MSDNKFNPASLSEVYNLISPNSIVGNPIIISDKITVIPVIKTTTLYLGGGGEYGEIKVFSPNKNHPFAGGVGTISNTVPCGFLVCKDSDVTFIKIPEDTAEKVFDKSLDLLKKAIKNED